MSQNTPPNALDVFCNLRGTRYFVGRLAERNRAILFEYDKDFLSSVIELSPFTLPLRLGVFEDKERTFDGLPGVFNDSLPDGWGLLLLDRALRSSAESF
jgi:serine/threonine-protein kinase HipA